MTNIILNDIFKGSKHKNIVVYCGECAILTANRVEIELINAWSTCMHIRVHYTDTYTKDVYIDPHKVTHAVVE